MDCFSGAVYKDGINQNNKTFRPEVGSTILVKFDMNRDQPMVEWQVLGGKVVNQCEYNFEFSNKNGWHFCILSCYKGDKFSVKYGKPEYISAVKISEPPKKDEPIELEDIEPDLMKNKESLKIGQETNQLYEFSPDKYSFSESGVIEHFMYDGGRHAFMSRQPAKSGIYRVKISSSNKDYNDCNIGFSQKIQNFDGKNTHRDKNV